MSEHAQRSTVAERWGRGTCGSAVASVAPDDIHGYKRRASLIPLRGSEKREWRRDDTSPY